MEWGKAFPYVWHLNRHIKHVHLNNSSKIEHVNNKSKGSKSKTGAKRTLALKLSNDFQISSPQNFLKIQI